MGRAAAPVLLALASASACGNSDAGEGLFSGGGAAGSNPNAGAGGRGLGAGGAGASLAGGGAGDGANGGKGGASSGKGGASSGKGGASSGKGGEAGTAAGEAGTAAGGAGSDGGSSGSGGAEEAGGAGAAGGAKGDGGSLASGGSGPYAGAIVPKTCAQAHGLTGCCGPAGNEVYYFQDGKLQSLACLSFLGTEICGWDAKQEYYTCVARLSGGAPPEEPSGKYPLICGGEPVQGACGGKGGSSG